MSFGGTGEDKALGGEHDGSAIFIYLEFFTGNDGAFCCADAKANTCDDGDADARGASDIGGRRAACFVEDACGRPESVFAGFLHECVGN